MTVAARPHSASRRDPPAAGAPWWRFGMVWFVFAGPAAVVVAGFVTMFIAYHGADVVLSEGPAENVSRAAVPGPVATTPAPQARNHVATPSP